MRWNRFGRSAPTVRFRQSPADRHNKVCVNPRAMFRKTRIRRKGRTTVRPFPVFGPFTIDFLPGTGPSSRSGIRRHIELVTAGRTFYLFACMPGAAGRGATGQHKGHQQHSEQYFHPFHGSFSFLPGEEVPVCLAGKPSRLPSFYYTPKGAAGAKSPLQPVTRGFQGSSGWRAGRPMRRCRHPASAWPRKKEANRSPPLPFFSASP